jgi:hypothetical protein
MPNNNDLSNARNNRNDEFYTSLEDIELEMNAYLEFNPDVFRNKTVLLPCDDPGWSNFTKYFAQKFEDLGLKKLISTSYAPHRHMPNQIEKEYSLWEEDNPAFDEEKSGVNGKIFTLERDVNKDNTIDVDDLEWEYLNGDGDFQSDEVKKLRDEADIVITNPPFSLFRVFLSWIVEGEKEFVILGSINAVSYKEVFPLFKANKLWLGPSISSGDREFRVPDSYPLQAASSRVDENNNKFIRVKGVRWFTNLDHGRRHQPLPLMTKSDNVRFSRHKEVQSIGYLEYDNYKAIDVPFTDAIPSDYKGAMGVPITFVDKYNPDQFEILDANDFRKPHQQRKNSELIKDADGKVGGVNRYVRVLIRHKRANR